MAAASEGRAGTLPRASGNHAGCMHSMNGKAGHANFCGYGREAEKRRLNGKSWSLRRWRRWTGMTAS